MTRNTIALLVLALAVGLAIGWLAGRWQLERSWAEPPTVLSEADVSRASAGDADPTPPAGTPVMAAMPLQRSRHALHELVATDPVRVRIGAIGRSDGEMFLHVTLHNHGTCTVREAEGVAYGFDASGHSARVNRGGEHYVAFHATDLDLAPGAETNEESSLHHVGTASIVLAQVDRVTCTDGTTWARD
jgi:hypothetical protein